MSAALLKVEQLRVHFRVPGRGWLSRRQFLRAVDGVDLTVARGETLGIVGESGCGKSTLARAILGLTPATSGRVRIDGIELRELTGQDMKPIRRRMQVIFQDPLASLDPRMTVAAIIAEPLRIHFPRMSRDERTVRVREMMERVGLRANLVNRYPHEFSGGQCQRIGIARALILEPDLVICDEPVSALDVSIQAQIVNLLESLQAELGLSLLFIAHDLSVVRHISHRVAVMYLGKVVELADRERLYAAPAHPYTRALIASVPSPDPAAARHAAAPLKGDLPSPIDPPSGCAFRTRCPLAVERCASETPQLREVDGRWVACHRAEEVV